MVRNIEDHQASVAFIRTLQSPHRVFHLSKEVEREYKRTTMKTHNLPAILTLSILAVIPALGQECSYDVGQWGYGPVSSIEVEDDLGLVATGAVLQVIDVTQPISLSVIGELQLPAVIEDLAHAGNGWAAVALGRRGLWLVDLLDPAAPLGRGVPLAGFEGSMTVVSAAGDRVYAVDQVNDGIIDGFRLTIHDISTPSSPVVLGSFSADGVVEDIAAGEDAVYLALTGARLLEIDATDPLQPGDRWFDDAFDGRERHPVRVEVCDDAVYFSQHHVTFEGATTVYAIEPSSLTESDSWSPWGLGPVYDIGCAGDALLLASQYSGVDLLDVSSPDGTVISNYGDRNRGRVIGVELAGDYALLADEYFGIRAIDASDPNELTEIGWLELPGDYPLVGMAVTGHYLIGSSWNDGLVVIDIEQPVKPRFVSSDPEIGLGSSIAVSDHQVYVAARERGVDVIDLATPETPILVGTIATDGDAHQVVRQGTHLLAWADSTQIFDISDPAQPVEIATLELSGRLDLKDDLLLIGAADGVGLFDFSESSSPSMLGWYDVERPPGESWVSGLTTAGDLAFAAWYNSGGGGWHSQLHMIDTSDPGAPAQLSTIDFLEPVWSLSSETGVLSGASEFGGVFTYNILDPESPSWILDLTPLPPSGNWGGSSWDNRIHGFFDAGDTAYVGLHRWTEGFTGLRILSMSDPARPCYAGMRPLPSATTGLAVGDGFGVTTEGEWRVRVFGLSDPQTPTSLAYLDLPIVDTQLELNGDVAYVIENGEGLRIIDLAVPSRPHVVEASDTRSSAIKMHDGLLYVAEIRKQGYPQEYALTVFDLSDSRSPAEVGSVETGSSFSNIEVGEGLAVGFSNSNLTRITIFDLTDPTAPVEIGQDLVTGVVTGAAITGGYLYLATSDGEWQGHPEEFGLRILSLADPAHPVEVAHVLTPGNARNVTVVGNLAYLSDGDAGVLVLDVSDPGFPVQVHRINTTGAAQEIGFYGSSMVVADGRGGLTVIGNLRCRTDLPDSSAAADD